MNYQFGFIGCGNMGGALATAVSKSVGGEKIALCDANLEKATALAAKLGAKTESLATLVANAQFIFLGVKPQVFASLFEELRPLLKKRNIPCVLVSMAAGLSLSALEAMAGVAYPIIRIMPNTPVAAGEGMILWCANSAVSDADVATFLDALSTAGKTDAIEESKIDAASALSGCGPAFVYLFAEALADGAVACGLGRDQANVYAAQTLLGAAKMLLESGKHPGELKDAVCSPGGTTIVGVHALEDGGFRSAAIHAVTAAYQRTLELKK